MKRFIAIFLIATNAHATGPKGPNGPKMPEPKNDCPIAADMAQRHLLGQWQAAIEGQPGGLLQLGPHPELTESVRGSVQRGGIKAQVAGDVDEGTVTLEESVNGTNISATWLGQAVEGSCGLEIRGTLQSASPWEPPTSFTLRKQKP